MQSLRFSFLFYFYFYFFLYLISEGEQRNQTKLTWLLHALSWFRLGLGAPDVDRCCFFCFFVFVELTSESLFSIVNGWISNFEEKSAIFCVCLFYSLWTRLNKYYITIIHNTPLFGTLFSLTAEQNFNSKIKIWANNNLYFIPNLNGFNSIRKKLNNGNKANWFKN